MFRCGFPNIKDVQRFKLNPGRKRCKKREDVRRKQLHPDISASKTTVGSRIHDVEQDVYQNDVEVADGRSSLRPALARPTRGPAAMKSMTVAEGGGGVNVQKCTMYNVQCTTYSTQSTCFVQRSGAPTPSDTKQLENDDIYWEITITKLSEEVPGTKLQHATPS